VPILEHPKWTPQRAPFDGLYDEVPHVVVSNETNWGAFFPEDLPLKMPGGDARKHYLPFWLHKIFLRMLEANITRATSDRPPPPCKQIARTEKNLGMIGLYPNLDGNKAGCRWIKPAKDDIINGGPGLVKEPVRDW